MLKVRGSRQRRRGRLRRFHSRPLADRAAPDGASRGPKRLSEDAARPALQALLLFGAGPGGGREAERGRGEQRRARYSSFPGWVPASFRALAGRDWTRVGFGRRRSVTRLLGGSWGARRRPTHQIWGERAWRAVAQTPSLHKCENCDSSASKGEG